MGQAIQQDQVSKSEVKGGEGMGHGGRLIVWEGWGPRFALQDKEREQENRKTVEKGKEKGGTKERRIENGRREGKRKKERSFY